MRNWAFLVHYRNEQDKEELKKAFGEVPREIKILSRASDGGYFILIPRSPEELLATPNASRRIILEAANYASNLGVSVIGLGELTASLTGGGKYLLNKVNKNPLITSGNSLTAAIVFSEVFSISEKMNNPLIGIVGATGSVGTAVSQFLAKKKKKRVLLFARNERKLSNLSQKVGGEYSLNLEDLTKVDIVVVLVSGNGNIINPEHISDNTVIYDATQPKNVNPFILEGKKDVSLIEGGLIKNPGVNLNFEFNLPLGMVYSCWVETKLLTQTTKRFTSKKLTGKTDYKISQKILKEAKKYGSK